MAGVALRNVTKRFGDTVVVKDVSLEIPDKEFCVLVGPSGCGKSTTLRMIAGLEEVSEGEVWIGNGLVNDMPPKDRDIAMVFQNYALYPHMTVYENMAFGLKLRGYARRDIDARVREAAEILNLGRYLERKPKELSGGQRQRVAVGRAIVRKPKVFLFDEPLSNLDAKLRMQMRAELQKLHRRLQTTMVYVTHDQVEAMTMGDRICVMKDGAVQQIDTPLNVYNHPINRFVAGFIGSPPMNFMKVVVVEEGQGIWLDEGQFSVQGPAAKQALLGPLIGREVVLGIRPEDIYDRLHYTKNSTEGKIVTGTVEVVEPMGNEILLFVLAGRHPLVARVAPHNEAQVGQEIELVFQMDKAHVFELGTDRRLI